MRKKLILIMACVLMFICLFTGCSQGISDDEDEDEDNDELFNDDDLDDDEDIYGKDDME